MDRLLVAVVGNRNSGKSHTWNQLFHKVVRTGKQERDLPLGNGELVKVFLVSGSPEERHQYVGDIVNGNPRIVLCSLQYRENVSDSIDYFVDHGFFSFVHWLNPGWTDLEHVDDRLALVPKLLANNSLVGIRNGKIDSTDRVNEMRDFIRGWASSRDLIIMPTAS